MAFRYLSSACKTCVSTRQFCVECDRSVCMSCDHKNHNMCLECQQVVVCHPCGVCSFCIHDNPFHMITDTVAVGNRNSPYELFDVVIDLNYPDNGVQAAETKIDRQTYGKLPEYKIRVGMLDCSLDEYQPFVDKHFSAIHELIEQIKDRFVKKQRKPPRILFHCYAGISRSVSTAAWHLSKISTEHDMTPIKALELIQAKRKIAQPNEGFVKTLSQFKVS